MVCTKCNHKLPDDSEFCQYCGSKIEASTIESEDNKAEIRENPITEETIVPAVENQTVAKLLASGIVEGQKAMESNKENQPHNELDTDFGLVSHKPIYTVGIDEQERYLKTLCTINGEPIKWIRRGSMSVDSVNGMVDAYDTYLPSGEEYKTIYINMYGISNSTIAPKGFSISNQLTATPSTSIEKHKSKGLKIAIIATGIVTILAVLFIAFAMLKKSNEIKASNAEHYYALRTEMHEMDEKLGSLDFIEEKLALLPSDYKDVSLIKEELIFIKSKYNVLHDAVFRILMKQIMTGETQEEIEEYYVDYAKVRAAYLSLKNNSDKYKNWNLEYFADDYVFNGDDNGVLLAVMVGLWKDSDGNYINIVETETNDLTFGSNLPNDKDSSKSYYYFIKGNIIGYESQTNSDDTISAYRIVEIGDDYVKVFCFKNSRTYTLH